MPILEGIVITETPVITKVALVSNTLSMDKQGVTGGAYGANQAAGAKDQVGSVTAGRIGVIALPYAPELAALFAGEL